MTHKKFPRVLQILPLFQEGGGVERGTRDIADALLTQGHEAFIASAGGNLVSSFVAKGGKHLMLPLHSKNPVTLLLNMKRLQHLVQENQIDILHARSRAPAWSTLVVAKALKIPLVTTYHAPYNNRGSRFKKLYNSVMARGDRVIAISQFVANHLHQQYAQEQWFDPKRVTVIPRGIDLRFFDPQRITPEVLHQLRVQYALPPHGRIVLLPGRLTRWKGQEIFLEAFAALQQNPDIYGVFLGKMDAKEAYVAELQQKMKAHGLQDRIRFVPHTALIPAFYALATVVVSASTDPEGFGRTIAEAGAMQRPIIATHHGAAPEIVIQNKTGWLIPPAHAQALRDALQHALSLPQEHLEQMGKNARTHIATHFSQENFCEKTLQLYEEIGKQSE